MPQKIRCVAMAIAASIYMEVTLQGKGVVEWLWRGADGKFERGPRGAGFRIWQLLPASISQESREDAKTNMKGKEVERRLYA